MVRLTKLRARSVGPMFGWFRSVTSCSKSGHSADLLSTNQWAGLPVGPVYSLTVQGPDVLQLCARWRSGVSGSARDGRPAQRVTCISLLSGVSARECGVAPPVFTPSARKKGLPGEWRLQTQLQVERMKTGTQGTYMHRELQRRLLAQKSWIQRRGSANWELYNREYKEAEQKGRNRKQINTWTKQRQWE